MQTKGYEMGAFDTMYAEGAKDRERNFPMDAWPVLAGLVDP